jgi:hypothetical protein
MLTADTIVTVAVRITWDVVISHNKTAYKAILDALTTVGTAFFIDGYTFFHHE